MNQKDRIFWDNVAALEAAHPLHPLLSTIKRGPGFINERYLKKALDQVRAGGSHQKVETRAERVDAIVQKVQKYKERQQAEADGAHVSDQALPLEIQKLYREQRSLYSQRRRLSNKFHTLGDDAARAKNSAEIQKIQKLIIENRSMMAMWHKDGIIPSTDQALVPGAVDMDGAQLHKKLNSLRAGLSRYRKKLKSARDKQATGGQLDEAADDIEALEMKIAWKIKQIEYVEDLIG